jgi:hypothetical protein
MCFSATASFVTAIVTGAIGVASATRVSHPRELPLACAPIFFAVQQSVEGMLWLALPSASGEFSSSGLTLAFLFFAEVFWPAYAPVAVVLIEPNEGRRRLMLPFLVLGAGIAAYLLWTLLTRPHQAEVVGDHIVYASESRQALAGVGVYLLATCAPFMLSSHRAIVLLGAIIGAGFAAAYAFYWRAFLSVWCFFAAAASVVVLWHFVLEHRRLYAVRV